MWMSPIGAWIGNRELVGERSTGRDVRGGRHGAVHIVLQRQSVPVHRGLLVQFVGEEDFEFVTDIGADQRTGNGVGVTEGVDHFAAEVHRDWPRGQRHIDGAAGVRTRGFGGLDGRVQAGGNRCRLGFQSCGGCGGLPACRQRRTGAGRQTAGEEYPPTQIPALRTGFGHCCLSSISGFTDSCRGYLARVRRLDGYPDDWRFPRSGELTSR